MNRRTFVLFSLCLFATSVRADLPLAEQNRALEPIIISPNASDSTKAIAKELASYLGRITEAKFDVQVGDGSRGIVLGTLAEFPNPALAKPLEIRNTYDGREAFAIRTEPKRLLLIGATDLGASHAVFRFLEHLGCRWYFPAQEWEVVAARKSLSVSLNETDRPRILARRIWYGYGAFADKGHPRGGSTQKDYQAWARHNRMAGSFTVHAGHAWQSIIADNKKVFAEHPEYLALVKGERKGPQLCVSNPDVKRLATEWALKQLDKNPTREMVSMECSDGHGHCECPECKKLGSVSDRVFGLANHVAREVGKKYPGKLVGCLAYSDHSEPPTIPLEPNVYVQLTAGFNYGRYSHDELVELWPKKCSNLGFYEYYSVWLWDFDKLPGGNGANLTRTKSMIDRYIKAGATSYDAESGNNWGVHGRGYYIANKLLWNPDADVNALLADFYDKAFGPAAAPMKRYYDRVAPDEKPIMSRGLIGEAFRDIAEGARLAQDRPEVLARIDQLKHYLRYVHLRWQLDHTQDKLKQKELTVEALTLAYRTRYEYMNHWAAMKQTFANDAAKRFDEPNWRPKEKGPRPWIVDKLVTSEETEQWFRAGLDYFKPTPVTEVQFTTDLVRAGFTSNKPAISQQTYQNAATYALFSVAGEPLELEFTAGIIVHYRDRPAAIWKLTDGTGNLVASGKVPLDGEAYKLAIKVPKAGPYYFEGKSSAGWRLKAEAGRSVSLLNVRGQRLLHLGQMQEMYFLVPKGTRDLQYFWSGGPHKVLDGERKIVGEVKTSDEVVTIAVPAGRDGQVWSLSPRAHSHLWFFNAPNVLAASPSALLLPREAAAAGK